MPASFFRTRTIRAEDAARTPDAIRQMRAGAFEGLLVRDVYPPDACARVVERLEAGDHGLVRMGFPAAMRAFFLGVNLNLVGPDLSRYFQEAPHFHDRLRALFGDDTDLETRVTGLLSALDGGRPYGSAPGPEPADTHMFTTLRAHMTDGFIPPHFDNEQAHRDSYRHITARIGADLFSFVLAFSQPEDGGALEVFDLHHGGQTFRMVDGPLDASHLNLDGVPSARFRLAPGEMILFNSGRFLHRVTPVIGAATRWTACSFMAESRSGDRVLCWG